MTSRTQEDIIVRLLANRGDLALEAAAEIGHLRAVVGETRALLGPIVTLLDGPNLGGIK